MEIKLKKEELEMLTYTDIAEIILTNSKKPMSTIDILTKIAELLEITEEDYKAKIGDFYTSMTTDKRFISLENGLWDLRDRHVIKIDFDEDEDDEEEENEEEEIEEENLDEEEEEEIVDDMADDIDDDMEDLSIISEDELEEE